MRNETRVKFNAYLSQVANVNGVPSAAEKFTVAPAVQQTMEQKIQASSSFLAGINISPVADQEGEKLGLGVGGSIASTQDTSVGPRVTTDIANISESNAYRCEQTNYDTHVRYGTLDAWARQKAFQTMLRDAILQRQALDRITIGWNGIARAKTSNRATNPLLQDVNKGWLQQLRENAMQRVMQEVVPGSKKINVGSGGDYKNIDALVFDMVNNLLDEWHQENTSLVVICGRKLLDDKYFPIINQDAANSEKLAADIIVSQKRIGNLPAVRVPFFPANGVLVTAMSNLSIYYQDGTRRRTVTDNASRDRIENYESTNEAYVIEDYGMTGFAENIVVA